jgi:pimeloyl-ACP methyl ester carboxylesterase
VGSVIAESGSARLAWSSEGDGEPVLLIHAGVTDRRSWSHLTERLVPQHRVVAYDQRGFGETTYEPEEHSRVADAIAVLDAAGIERAAVVGCSMGGGIAIDLALEHPDRVSRLVLIAASVSGAPWLESYPEPFGGLVARLEAAEEAGDVDETNRLEAWLWLDGAIAPEGRVGGAARELFLEMNRIALSNEDTGEAIRPEPAWDRLEKIAVPTLVLSGELDLPDQLTVSQGMVNRIPDARLIELPGVAHLPHLENDDTCLTAITEFLSPST